MHKSRICLCQNLELCSMTTKYSGRIARKVQEELILTLIGLGIVKKHPNTCQPMGIQFEYNKGGSNTSLNIKFTIFEPNNIEKISENVDLLKDLMLKTMRLEKFKYRTRELERNLLTDYNSTKQKVLHKLKPLSK